MFSTNTYTDENPVVATVHKHIRKEDIEKAEHCLVDNGVDPDEVCTVLQAIGYILLDEELYPEPK